MAFKFFRRRQKTVLMVMVLLMVAFLVPTLFQGLGKSGDRDAVIGYINEEKVTIHMIRAAEHDLRLLNRSIRLDMGLGRDASLTWTLLLHEAGQMGITFKEEQVDSFLIEAGLTGEAYRRVLANLRESGGYTEKRLRQAISHYLMVTKAFQAAEINTPPSVPELRRVFGNLKERIRLATVTIPAEDFTTDAPEPSQEDVFSQFERHKHFVAKGRGNKTDFGFGYRLPNRLEVAWLFIDEEALARAVEPDEKKMMQYWNEHGGELKKRIPIASTPPVEDPPGGADTQPSQPVEPKFREVPFESFSQAKSAIREIFMPGAVDAAMNETISLARGTIQRVADNDDPYSAAVRAMMRPADALLGKKVGPLPFNKGSVEAFIEELEEETKVKIVYPFGKHDKLTLDGKIEIKVKAWDKITLGEALERIGRKAKFPSIKWVTCAGMDGVLFASEPINLVPISAGRTGMVGFAEVHSHELLGRAGLKSGDGRGGRSLLSIAATAEVFQPPGKKHGAMIEPGSDFDRALYVFGDRKGRLLWRLVKAEADHAPPYLTDEIRKQVVKDIKTVSGFKKALSAADALKAELVKPDADLEKLASKKKFAFAKTEPFARKTLQHRTGRIFASFVPGVGADERFIEQAFRLIPSDPDEPGDDKPSAVIPLRRQEKVMLVQRIGYEPATEEDFESLIVGQTIVPMPRQDKDGNVSMGYDFRNITLDEVLMSRLRQRTARMWFSAQGVAKRVNYRQEHPSE